MQERHIDRDRYFEEQAQTTRKYYIPYIKQMTGSLPLNVLEVGCGEGGNLLPFAEQGCEVVGVDISAMRIRQARTFFSRRNRQGAFIASDIFRLKELEKHFSLILIHDVIEHIDDKARFLSDMQRYLSVGGVIFLAFPAWQMPFGGHQQIARGRIVSHLPFIHLLPRVLYRRILQMGGEDEDTIKELLSIKETKCTVEMIRDMLRQTGYEVIDRQLFFINPHYEVKFGLTPRKLGKAISALPYVRNFFSTTCFYLLTPSQASLAARGITPPEPG